MSSVEIDAGSGPQPVEPIATSSDDLPSPYRARIEMYLRMLRDTLGVAEDGLHELIDLTKQQARSTGKAHDAEGIAHVTLALRHVEDARMRLGEVTRHAVQGGVAYGPPVR